MFVKYCPKFQNCEDKCWVFFLVMTTNARDSFITGHSNFERRKVRYASAKFTQAELKCTLWIYLLSSDFKSLMKQQFVVTHTIRQTEIPALPDSWIKNTLSAKKLCTQTKNCLNFYFRKNTTCLTVGLLRICQVFFYLLYNCVSVDQD